MVQRPPGGKNIVSAPSSIASWIALESSEPSFALPPYSPVMEVQYMDFCSVLFGVSVAASFIDVLGLWQSWWFACVANSTISVLETFSL